MGFVYNDFGTLSKVENRGSYILITNTSGDTRKMSTNKYKESAERVYTKAQTLIGKEVQIQTSQNTNNWSASEWFSDISTK